MYWFIITGAILLAAIGLWWWQRRREVERARDFRRVADAIEDAEDPLVAVARNFWFPALGAYGKRREAAVRMLEVFGAALPADAARLAYLVENAAERIAETGELDDERATALRALFNAIDERGGLDDELRASLSSGELDWAPEHVDEDAEQALSNEQRDVLRRLRKKLANEDSEAVVQAVDERIDDEGLQSVYRAALLDCRGRAYLQLERPEEAVRDFEAASRLAPDTDLRSLAAADADG
ncbi:MAG: hypothetical protein ACQEVA_22740 [Myxococcota bacterium]